MPKANSLLRRLGGRVRVLMSLIVAWLATPVVRGIIICIGIGVLLYFLYLYSWVHITKQVELPPGVTPTNPELEIPTLKNINAQRAERIQTAPADVSAYTKLFVPSKTGAR